MQRGMLSVTHHGDFVYFSSYVLAGLVPLLSSLFLMLLEHYGFLLQHLSPHSITLVVIFVHFYEMFVRVRPSVRLFRRFHVMRPVNKQPPCLSGYYFQHRLSGYYFQHQTKGPSKYITALSPDRWERWREDWVLVQIDAHEQLMLSSTMPMAPRVHWEQDLGLEPVFNPVLGRIRILTEDGLTSMMVLHNYVPKHITPLQEHTRPVWLYNGVNTVTWLECIGGSVLGEEALALVMRKLSPDPSSHDFVTPPTSCQPLCMDQAASMLLLVVMPSMDDVGITPVQRGDKSCGV
jgi:hypothetical protein